MSSTRSNLRFLIFACVLWACQSASASLVITITEQPSGGIEFAWSGNGTILGGLAGAPGPALTFDGMGFINTDDNVDVDLIPAGVDFSGLNLSYNGVPATFSSFEFEDDLGGAEDDIRISTSISGVGAPADPWAASGSFITTAGQYPFSKLIAGSYNAAANSDSAAFGGVSLTVVAAVPEPSSFVFMGMILGGVGFLQWKKKFAAGK